MAGTVGTASKLGVWDFGMDEGPVSPWHPILRHEPIPIGALKGVLSDAQEHSWAKRGAGILCRLRWWMHKDRKAPGHGHGTGQLCEIKSSWSGRRSKR